MSKSVTAQDVNPHDDTKEPMGRRMLQWVEYAGASLLLGFLGLLPLDWASDLGGFVGRAVGPFLRRLNRTARSNLALAFPEKSREEIDAIIKGMWDNLGRNLGEFPHINRLDCYNDPRIEVVGAEIVDRVKDDGQPGIFISAHMANWEMAGTCIAQRGFPVHLIYRASNNPLLTELYNKRRPSPDSELIPKGSAGGKRTYALLKRGEHIGLLVDQKMNEGIAVPFFGRDAMTAPGMALFALKFKCPVVPVHIERIHRTNFRITFSEPLELFETGDKDADVRAMTGRVNRLLEDWIRQRPEQWLWVHRRWPK